MPDRSLARAARSGTELAQAARPASTVRLHPNAAEVYRAKVADLEVSLNASESRVEATEALRSLIGRIVLTPDATARDGLAAELHGDLATILRLAAERQGGDRTLRRAVGENANPSEQAFSGGQLSVVAGTRNRRSHYSLVPI